MKKLMPFVFATLVLATAGAARADDAAPWTGCYLGAHAGYGFGGSTYYDPQSALNGNPTNNAIDQSGGQQPFQMNESGVLAGARPVATTSFTRSSSEFRIPSPVRRSPAPGPTCIRTTTAHRD